MCNLFKKYNENIKFVIFNLFRILFEFIFSILLIRKNNLIVMGLRTPVTKTNRISTDYFMHNTKYLFLYLNQFNKYNFNIVYLCDDKKMVNKFKEKNLKNIFYRKSFKGLITCLLAKYWIHDDHKYCIGNSALSGGAISINLFHGTGGLKSVGNVYKRFRSNFVTKIYLFLSQKDNFYNIDSEHEIPFRKYAFGVNDKNITILGSPRLDVLFHDIPNSDLFMEEDFDKIKQFKKQGKKLFFYTPTFRDTGKNIANWLKSSTLHQFLKNNNAVLVCKLHFADKNSLDFELPEEIYKMDSMSDIYPVLKYADCLISDYSSIYFAFLLLDKPIIYHVPDLEEYQEQCRGFYEPYENLTAGVKTRTEDEIIAAMQDVVNGIDNYKEDRKRLRDQTFKYQDGKNCERVVEWIKSLG